MSAQSIILFFTAAAHSFECTAELFPFGNTAGLLSGHSGTQERRWELETGAECNFWLWWKRTGARCHKTCERESAYIRFWLYAPRSDDFVKKQTPHQWRNFMLFSPPLSHKCLLVTQIYFPFPALSLFSSQSFPCSLQPVGQPPLALLIFLSASPALSISSHARCQISAVVESAPN